MTVLLTAPWHERSTRDVVDRYNAEVWIEPLARERISDLPEARTIPAGVEVFRPRGVSEGQVAFFIKEERALVVAEFLLGTPTGLQLCPSPATDDIGEFAESMNELRLLPIERVLVAHGQSIFEAGRTRSPLLSTRLPEIVERNHHRARQYSGMSPEGAVRLRR